MGAGQEQERGLCTAGQGRAGQDGGGQAGEVDSTGSARQGRNRCRSRAGVCACESVRLKLKFIHINDFLEHNRQITSN